MALTPYTTYLYTGVHGTTLSATAYEADVGTRGSAKFQKWAVCPRCGHEFPATQFTKVGGVYLCVPNGCYRDGDNRWV